jgi:predicted negative regulator of RcsB-dependent stress response
MSKTKEQKNEPNQPAATTPASTENTESSKVAVYLEDPELLAENATAVFEKNKNLLTYIAAGLVAVVGGYFFYLNYQSEKEKEAQANLYPAIYAYESDSLSKALNGGANLGLLSIADDYSGTDAGELAAVYAGAALLKEKKFDEAITYLKKYSAKDAILQARVYSLIGDAYMEQNNYTEAVSAYKQAAEYKKNKEFTPVYLLKLGIAQEKAGLLNDAFASYTEIIDSYPFSAEVNNAKKYRGIVSASLGN